MVNITVNKHILEALLHSEWVQGVGLDTSTVQRE
jgi:hypothetical protein